MNEKAREYKIEGFMYRVWDSLTEKKNRIEDYERDINSTKWHYYSVAFMLVSVCVPTVWLCDDNDIKNDGYSNDDANIKWIFRHFALRQTS